MKIGLDVHGVIDRFPAEFALLTKRWLDGLGHEVHIVTGSPWDGAEPQVKKMGIQFSHHFSIVDHHRGVGTIMTNKESGWWMEQETWNRSKGDYAKTVDLDIHFEDTLAYAPWFPSSCTFIHVGRRFDIVQDIVTDFLGAYRLFE